MKRVGVAVIELDPVEVPSARTPRRRYYRCTLVKCPSELYQEMWQRCHEIERWADACRIREIRRRADWYEARMKDRARPRTQKEYDDEDDYVFDRTFREGRWV